MAKWVKWLPLACFLLVISLLTLDWLSKHLLYLEQRDALYNLIQSGVTQIEEHKKVVAYLQGTATRRLNDLVEVTVLFSVVFFVHFFYCKWRDRHA